MRLILKNIGMIKEADVFIKGLTVIAGENDSGKSTVGKVLLSVIKTDVIARAKYFKKKKELGKKGNEENLIKYFYKNRKYGFNRLRELLFKDFLRTNLDLFDLQEKKYLIELYPEMEKELSLKIAFNKDNNEWEFNKDSFGLEYKNWYKDITYIQSPIIWDLQSFFNSILQMKSQVELEEDIKFNFEYPYILWDLYGKLVKKKIERLSSFHSKIIENITQDIINGRFVKKEGGIFVFRRKNVDIPLVNVAHGIKSFGILQVLLENGYISQYGILIIDEPEVHLHPKWQLKYAEILVKLAKRGVKILVHSHSPYMIEALKRYSEAEKYEENVLFYLAENGYITKQENLENIFEKLAIPMRKLRKLKMEKYTNQGNT